MTGQNELAKVTRTELSRAPRLKQWRLRASYAWDQSADHRIARLRAWLDSTMPNRWCCVVSESEPGALTLSYAGITDGTVKILELLEQRREELGYETSWRSEEQLRRTDLLAGRERLAADLIAIGCANGQADRLPTRSSLVLPFRIHLVVDLGGGPVAVQRQISKREREKFKADFRGHGWAIRLATDIQSFEHFYARMHMPTMRARHGARARTDAQDLAKECLFRRGALFFVTADNVRVAGVLCHWNQRSRILTMRLLGVLDGDREHYDSGAFRALYHLLLDWACRNGVNVVDFGGTEAWIAKGIFQWKRKFGPRVIPAPNHYGYQRVWWHAAADTPNVRNFMVENPVLEPAGSHQFRAVYFYDDHRPPRLDIACRCANVQQFRTVHLDSYLAGLPTTPAVRPVHPNRYGERP